VNSEQKGAKMSEHDRMNWKRGTGLLLVRGQAVPRERGEIRGGVWFVALKRDDREPTTEELVGGEWVRLWPGEALEFRRFYAGGKCAICCHVTVGLVAVSVGSVTRRE